MMGYRGKIFELLRHLRLTVFLAYALVILIIPYLYFKNLFSYWERRKLEYVIPVPFFGNLLDIFLFKRNIGEQLATIYREATGPMMGIFMLNRPAIVLTDPDLIKKILIRNFDHFHNRSVSNGVDETKNPNGTLGMLVSKDETWKSLRKTLTPAFSASKLKSANSDIQKKAEKMVEYIRQQGEIEAETNLRDISSRYVIECGCSTFYGIEPDCFSEETSPYMVANSNLFDYRVFKRGVHIGMGFISPAISKFLKFEFFQKASSNFLVTNLAKTLGIRKEKSERRNDYLDLLGDAMKGYTGQGNYLYNAVEIFVANNETLSAILTFSCYELVKNPDIQTKLREEMLKVRSNNNVPLAEQIVQMTYLESFMKEILRMYPSVPFLDRICKSDFHLDDPKITIEEGTCVYVPILGIHFDPKYYPEPHIFNPDRYQNDTIDWSVYLPFGKGPRMCPAKRYSEVAVKFFLIYLLTNFELGKSSRTPEKMTLHTTGFTLQPAGDLFVATHPLSEQTIY